MFDKDWNKKEIKALVERFIAKGFLRLAVVTVKEPRPVKDNTPKEKRPKIEKVVKIKLPRTPKIQLFVRAKCPSCNRENIKMFANGSRVLINHRAFVNKAGHAAGAWCESGLKPIP